MKISDFFEMFDNFENNVAGDYFKKYSLTDEQFNVLNLLVQQRESLLMNVYTHYFKGDEYEDK